MSNKVKWPAFLLSSYRGCWKVVGSEINCIHRGHGLYYGITWSEDTIYVGYRGSQADNVPEVVMLNRNYKQFGKAPGAFNEVHQILYVNGKLFVTATMDNAIDVVEGRKRTRVNWTDTEEDRDHINSIFFDGEDFWVCYHSLNIKDRSKKESLVVKLDNSLTEVLEEYYVGRGIHNVFVDNEYIYVCDSSTGSLARLNIVSGNVVRVPLGPWTRGLAVTEDYILVGSSVKGPRGMRLEGDLCVHLLDRNTLDVLDGRVFADFGAVFSIRVIGERDYAHTDILFPGVI
jgi:hypothetical protein